MNPGALSLSRPLKRSFMMLADGGLIFLSLWFSLILVNPEFFTLHQPNTYTLLFVLSAVCSVVVFYKAGLYRTVLLYMGIQSGLVIFKGVTVSALLTGLIVYLTDALTFPGQAIIVFWMTALLTVGGLRFASKLLMQNLLHNFRPREPVLIYGAGSSGMQLAAALNNGEQYLPVAFIDDSEAVVGNTVHGTRVYGPASIRELIDHYSVRQILLAMPSATHAERKQILNNLEIGRASCRERVFQPV
jgi:FlaA1/EpsC-like NDP-sugar epimerase